MDGRGRAFLVLGMSAGAAAALVGWWAISIAPAIIDEAVASFGDPPFPIGPQLVVVAVVVATCATALLSRPAALTMAGLGALFIGYSLLVFMELAPAPVSADGGIIGEAGPVRQTLYAITIGGGNLPLLTLGGLWVGIAIWWLVNQGAWPLASGRLAPWILAGVGVAVVGWWVLPVVARAMVIMFVQGREAFSPVPALMSVALAAGLVWLALRWPGVGLGAAAAALAFVLYSLADSDPGWIAGGAAQWTIGLDDLVASVRSTAYRASAIELAAAWALIATSHLLLLRSTRARDAVAEQPAAVG